MQLNANWMQRKLKKTCFEKNASKVSKIERGKAEGRYLKCHKCEYIFEMFY